MTILGEIFDNLVEDGNNFVHELEIGFDELLDGSIDGQVISDE